MRAADDPVGPDNDRAILDSVDWSDSILCAWGNHGLHLNRATRWPPCCAAPAPRFASGLTGQGQPRHPLYVGYGQQPQAW